MLHCYPFLPCAGSSVPAVIWVCWSETLKRPSSQSDPLRSHTSAFVSREECGAGDWRRVGFPISEAASCEGGLATTSPLHHTRNKVLIVCLLPAAAVLAQAFGALSVLVPGLHIWQLMVWLCFNMCQPKLIISWACNASLLLKGEGPASLFSLLLPVWCTPFLLAAVSLVEPLSLFTVC